MSKNHKVVDNDRRVRQLHAGETEELREFFTHYRDTCYGSGSVPLTWAREASQLILTLLDERESLRPLTKEGN